MTSDFENNPIQELINDDVFLTLSKHGLLDEKAIRDYIIRNKFHELRQKRISTGDAIDSLRGEYPYLQFDTIRKIVYQTKS